MVKSESIEATEVNLQTASSVDQNSNNTNKAVTSSDAFDNEGTKVLKKPCHIKVWNWVCHLCATHFFLIGIIKAMLIAKVYPPLGAVYLYPQVTATWIAVMLIFLLTGLGLKSEEFGKAFRRLRINSFVQIFNFGAVSGFVYGFTRLALALGILSKELAEGMIICACMPLSVNMTIILTASVGGDEAAAVFNTAFSNLVGVFLSPVLILGYIGMTGDVDLVSTFTKMAIRVLLPIIIGQIIRKMSKSVVNFMKKHKKKCRILSELSLIFIVYTVFCKTFMDDPVSSTGEIMLMILYQFICLSLLMIIAWFGLKLFFPGKAALHVMGLFGCTHKTIAMGIPLIDSMYGNSPNVDVYTLPLLIWYTMALVMGSALVPKLKVYVVKEIKLGHDSKESNIESLPSSEESDIEKNEKLEITDFNSAKA